jgi:hypothetical protein
MLLSSLSSAQIKQLIQLIKEKESIEAKLLRVTKSLNAFEQGKAARKAAATRSPRRGRRRTKLKEAILKALQVAGKGGLTVKELAASLKANPGSVSVWFYTTGKNVKGLKKIGPGKYSYSG